VNQNLFRHRALTNLVEGLNDDRVLGEDVQVGNLQSMLVTLILDELDGFKEIGFVISVNGFLVSDVIAEDVSVPVFAKWRLPRDSERVLIDGRDSDVDWRAARSFFGGLDGDGVGRGGTADLVLSDDPEVVRGGRTKRKYSSHGLKY
jgi:hypothetical protein